MPRVEVVIVKDRFARLTLACLALLAGCSGGGGATSLPPVPSSVSAPGAAPVASASGVTERGPLFDGQAPGSAISSGNVRTLALAWQSPLGSTAYYTPAISGTTVIASSTSGIAAFDANSGRQLWSFSGSQGYTLYSAPTISGTSVYVGTAWKGGAIYALDLATGNLKWSRDFGSTFSIYGGAMPTASGIVAIGLSDATLTPCSHGAAVGLDPGGGATLWEHDTAQTGSGAGVWNTLGVNADGSLLVPTGNPCNYDPNTEGDSILDLDPQSGTERWKFTNSSALALDLTVDADLDFGATPVAANGTVLVPSKDGILFGINAASGALQWQTQIAYASSDPTRGGSISGPAWDGKTLYVGGGDVLAADGSGYLNALSPSGTILWKITSPAPVTSPPSVSNDLVFAGIGTSMVAASSANGAVAWSAPTGGIVFGGAAIANNRLYFTSEDGTLRCYQLPSSSTQARVR